MSQGDGFLALDGLTRSYGTANVVENLSLTLARGELLALLGPSGCGKTTTLRMIAGLVPVSAGRIRVDGRDITALPTHKRNMGLVFQNYALFPHMTVAGNVAFGLEVRRRQRRDITRAVAEALALVRLEALAGRRPKELSGGQQQRVALARALATEPAILLLDEPLSNLDARLRDEMRSEIRAIQQRLGMTAVFVTHDQVEALSMCDKVGVMNAGRLEQLATPLEIYERPATAFVASFVGRVNRFAGIGAGDGTVAVGRLRLGVPGRPQGPVEIMVRPHRIAVGGARSNATPGEISRVTFVGDLFQYSVAADGLVIEVEQASASAPPLAVGTAVTLTWRVEDTMVFPAAELPVLTPVPGP